MPGTTSRAIGSVVSDRNGNYQLLYRFIALCCNPLAPQCDRDIVNSRHREALKHFKRNP
jgi:hypothetical protein